MSGSLREVFDTEKPIVAVLHLTGCDSENRLKRALQEIEILKSAGIRNVLVEDYYGSKSDIENVLKRLAVDYRDIMIYGVNVLESFEESFRLAVEYNAAFIQVDSISGDLLPKEDKKRYGEDLQTLRKNHPEIFVLGGVRAKGFPVSSGRSLEEDVLIGKSRCDAVVVTGYDTGIETELIKIQEFRKILGDFPLIVGSGITAENVNEQLYAANGAIVGSFLKEQGKTGNLISEDRVVKLMNQIKEADDTYNLKRFLEVQKSNYCGYHYVLKRLRCGQRNEKRKERLTELIAKGNRDDNNIGILWLTFPRVECDNDPLSNHFAFKSYDEAIAYLRQKQLHKRIVTLCHALLAHDFDEESMNDVIECSCDRERVKSSVTLFSEISDEKIFCDVLDLYFKGEKCQVTMKKLEEWRK